MNRISLLLTLSLLAFLTGCSQEYWDKRALDHYREQMSSHWQQVNDKQYEQAIATLSSAKADLADYRTENPNRSKRIDRAWARLHSHFAEYYAEQYQRSSDSEVKSKALQNVI